MSSGDTLAQKVQLLVETIGVPKTLKKLKQLTRGVEEAAGGGRQPKKDKAQDPFAGLGIFGGKFGKQRFMRWMSRDLLRLAFTLQFYASTIQQSFDNIVKSSMDLEGAFEDLTFIMEDAWDVVGEKLAPAIEALEPIFEAFADIISETPLGIIIALFALVAPIILTGASALLSFVATIGLVKYGFLALLPEFRDITMATKFASLGVNEMDASLKKALVSVYATRSGLGSLREQTELVGKSFGLSQTAVSELTYLLKNKEMLIKQFGEKRYEEAVRKRVTRPKKKGAGLLGGGEGIGGKLAVIATVIASMAWAMEPLMEMFEVFSDLLGMIFGPMIESISELVGDFVSTLMSILEANPWIVEALRILAGVIMMVIASFSGVGLIPTIILTLVGAISILDGVFRSLSGGLIGLADIFRGFFDIIATFINLIQAVIYHFVGGSLDDAIYAVTGAFSFLQPILGIIGSAFNILGGIVSGIAGIFGGIAAGIMSFFGGVTPQVQGSLYTMGGAVDTFTGKTLTAMNSLSNVTLRVYDDIKSASNEVVGTLMTTVTGLSRATLQAGADIIALKYALDQAGLVEIVAGGGKILIATDDMAKSIIADQPIMLQQGGFIKRPTVAMLHAGETVLPAGTAMGDINVTVNASHTSDPNELARVISEEIESHIRRRSLI
jgi:hypothetical protein